MKQIIQRKLPLNQRYVVTDKKYIPLIESFGTCCDNCGQLIANIATVQNESGQSFTIGFDCLETLLINNSLLSAGDIAEYERIKKMIPKVLRFAKSIKATVNTNKLAGRIVTGIRFEPPQFQSDYYPFYWLQNNHLVSRDNDYVKLTDVNFSFVIQTLKNIFPNLTIIV